MPTKLTTSAHAEEESESEEKEEEESSDEPAEEEEEEEDEPEDVGSWSIGWTVLIASFCPARRQHLPISILYPIELPSLYVSQFNSNKSRAKSHL